MSTLLEQASLVMIPSGYKEDVVYSQIPTNGSGDLSFTRASNGTRVNSAGLVEVCPWNLLEQSEDFSNTSIWNVLNSASVSANTTTAPNGTTTADTLTFSANPSSNVYCLLTPTTGTFTLSVYAKTASGTKKFCLRADVPGGTTSTDFTATTEWQRFEFSVTGTPQTFYIINDSAGTAGSIYIWGAQLNIGSTAKPYFPTTDRLNVPRLTYQNGGGGCPSLLLEKQSTNLAVQSQSFTSPWVIGNDQGTNPVITANYGISPDGTQNASRIQLARTNSTTSYSQIYQYPISVTYGASYTWSVWLKSLSGTPTISIIGDFGRPSVTLTNEWVRYSGTGTASSSLSQLEIAILGSSYATGNSLSADFLAWGYQFEQSSYPTSYIPTTSASATRVADASNTGVSSSILPQASGTIFVQFDWQKTAVDSNILSVHNNSNNLAWITKNSSTQLFGTFFMSGYIGTIQPTISASSGIIKVAYAWTNGSQTMFVNGVEVGTATGTISSSPNFNAVQLNGFWGINKDGCEIQQAVLFQIKLTNAELAQLTA